MSAFDAFVDAAGSALAKSSRSLAHGVVVYAALAAGFAVITGVPAAATVAAREALGFSVGAAVLLFLLLTTAWAFLVVYPAAVSVQAALEARAD